MNRFFAAQIWRVRPWPVGLLGALALIVVVESVIAHHPIETLTAIQWEYRRARLMAEGRVNDCPILAFGDSMVKLGVVPETLRAATGRQAYNFALTASQAPAAYYLLKRAIDSGARPAAVLVDYFPKQLGGDPRDNVDHWPLLLDPAELADLSAGHGDWPFLAMLGVRKALPSIRAAQKIRRRIGQTLAGQSNIEREGLLVGLRHWEANRGAQLNPGPGPAVNLSIWSHGYFAMRWVHPTNRDYVHRFLNLAEQHAIPVFWLLPPYQPAMQIECEQSGFDQFHETYVRKQMARHPNLRVIDGRHAHYDPTVFQDPHHLAGAGALVYSAQVGEVLRDFFAAPATFASAWVTLPVYQPRPSIREVESLVQSREVLEKTGVLRR